MKVVADGQTSDAILARFEDNISERDVKQPFRFTYTKTTNAVNTPSFSGSDARVLILTASQLTGHGKTVGSLFEGVYESNVRPPAAKRLTDNIAEDPMRILLETLDSTFADQTDDKGPFISHKRLAELQFEALHNCYMCVREKWIFPVDKYKYWVEVYWQCTRCLFGHNGFTPYKAKLDVIWRLVEAGNITLPFFHMSEAMEKSHHTASKDFHARSMRDGGYILRHQSSDFTELFFSFQRAMRLAILRLEKNSQSINNVVEKFVDHMTDNNFGTSPVKSEQTTPTYLELVEASVEPAPPNFGAEVQEKEDILRGFTFTLVGDFDGTTQPILAKKIEQLGGKVVNGSKLDTMAANGGVSHFLCVIDSRTKLDEFVNKTINAKMTGKFLATTNMNTTYVLPSFILECYKQTKLVPLGDSLITIDEAHQQMFRRRHATLESRLIIRQKKAAKTGHEMVEDVSAVCAYNRYKRKIDGRDKTVPPAKKRRIDPRVQSRRLRGWCKFRRTVEQKHEAGRLWKSLTDVVKRQYEDQDADDDLNDLTAFDNV